MTIARRIFSCIALLALTSCASLQGDPLEAYLLGVNDGIREAQANHPSSLAPPDVYVDMTTRGEELGSCRVIADRRVVYLYVASILGRVRNATEARLKIAEVLAHELGHAALTCSDADHSELQ